MVGKLGGANLSFETIRQTTYDERLLIEEGEFDFRTDRHGWASYTRVSCDITSEQSVNPITVLLECLNQLIRHLRDTTGSYWLYDLELVDLFSVSIESEGENTVIGSHGRTGGVTLPVTGFATETIERLKIRLSDHEQVLEWRMLQLDAEDAFNLGKYEEAVLLGWGALEATCRTETPRLARTKGVSAVELEQRITGNIPSRPPFSLEEVVERAHIRNLFRVFCELSETGYDSGSLTQSARSALQLRNVITHRGIRLSRSQAHRALEAISFVFNALGLPTSRSPGPFDYQTWIEHFGKASIDFTQLLSCTEGRIVVYRTKRESTPDPLTYWFQLERADNSFLVRVPEEISEEIAATLLVVTNDSYMYSGGQFPSLRVKPSMHLIRGLLDELAQTTTGAVHWAHASMIRATTGLPVQLACDYAIDYIWRGFTRLSHTIDSGDVRFNPLCTKIASYLVHASPDALQRFRQKMSKSHSQISEEVVQVEKILATLIPEEPHSICDVLRALHRRTTWLDSIVVHCPFERAEYGTQKRELQKQ